MWQTVKGIDIWSRYVVNLQNNIHEKKYLNLII